MTIELIRQYKAGEITRQEFCRQLSELQGFDGQVRTYEGEKDSGYLYRGRIALLLGDKLYWFRNQAENDLTVCMAGTLKEFKIMVDIDELRELEKC